MTEGAARQARLHGLLGKHIVQHWTEELKRLVPRP